MQKSMQMLDTGADYLSQKTHFGKACQHAMLACVHAIMSHKRYEADEGQNSNNAEA